MKRNIGEQLSAIEQMIEDNRYYTSLPSKALFHEIHRLLRSLLAMGRDDLCSDYCNISTYTTYRPHPAKGNKPPIKIKELCIDSCTFAPSLTEVFASNKAIGWENYHNPAVV